MPGALRFVTRAAVGPRSDRLVRIYSRNFDESATFDLEERRPVARRHWSDYAHGVAVILEQRGQRLRGADLAIEGGVPIGAGLSSSAALEVATALALLANSGITMDRTDVAFACQRAENEFVGAHSGIMDQFISCRARAGHLMLLDCRSFETRYVGVPESVRLVICDTMVHHDLASGEYNVRRAQCEEGVNELARFLPGIKALRDVSLEDLKKYGAELQPAIYRRCRHVVTENARVLDAAAALEREDLEEVGRLMSESHRSLRDDYEVSCEELDVMVGLAADLAAETRSVYGARMTGGGFGGSTVNLVKTEAAAGFAADIAGRYQRKTGHACTVHICFPEGAAAEEHV
jgi:galactokinase